MKQPEHWGIFYSLHIINSIPNFKMNVRIMLWEHANVNVVQVVQHSVTLKAECGEAIGDYKSVHFSGISYESQNNNISGCYDIHSSFIGLVLFVTSVQWKSVTLAGKSNDKKK